MQQPNESSRPGHYKPKRFNPYPVPKRNKKTNQVEIRFRDQVGSYKMAFDFERVRPGGGGAKRMK